MADTTSTFDINALVAETVGTDTTTNVQVANATASEAKSKSGLVA